MQIDRKFLSFSSDCHALLRPLSLGTFAFTLPQHQLVHRVADDGVPQVDTVEGAAANSSAMLDAEKCSMKPSTSPMAVAQELTSIPSWFRNFE